MVFDELAFWGAFSLQSGTMVTTTIAKPPSTRELVKQITYRPKERVQIFSDLPVERQANIVLKLSSHIQAQLLPKLEKELLLALLNYLDPDDATDLLQIVPAKLQKTLLTELSEKLQQDISLLLQFDPKTAAGLMSLNYIRVEAKQNMKEVVEEIKGHEQRTGKFPIVLIMEEEKLIGYVPNHKLAFAELGKPVKEYLRKIPALAHTTEYKKVLRHFLDHPHGKTAVLGENGAVLGILYSDDVLRAIRDQEASTLYDFAGVHSEETVFDSAKSKVRFRYKWLIINLGTAFLASATVSLFSETISKYVLLAIYMPIVAGMGGNASTQTLAVMVRGIALQQIDIKNSWLAIKEELGAALINGLINGALVAGIVLIFNREPMLALILAMAMVINLLVAGFFGTLIPLIMVRLGKDPAASATVFISTATDVLGFLAFLGLATILLK